MIGKERSSLAFSMRSPMKFNLGAGQTILVHQVTVQNLDTIKGKWGPENLLVMLRCNAAGTINN